MSQALALRHEPPVKRLHRLKRLWPAKPYRRLAAYIGVAGALASGVVFGFSGLHTAPPGWLLANPSAGLDRTHDSLHYADDQAGQRWLGELYRYVEANGLSRGVDGREHFATPHELQALFDAHVQALEESNQPMSVAWQGVRTDLETDGYSLIGSVDAGSEERGDVTIASSSNPDHLRMYVGTAAGHGVRLDAKPGQKPVFSPEFQSHLNGGHIALLAVSGVSELLFLAGLLFGGLSSVLRDIADLRRRTRERKERLANWRAVVSPAFGPQEPKHHFTLYQAKREEVELADDIVVRFQIVQLRWTGQGFSEVRSARNLNRLPGIVGKRLEWRMSEGYPQVMDAWVDFCAAVAQLNADAWAKLKAEHERKLEQERARRQEEEWKAQAAQVAADLGPVALMREELKLLPSAERVTADLRLDELAEAHARLDG